MKIISKLDPQPNEHGIFSIGSTRITSLDENGYHIYDPDWDLKPFGPFVIGAWLAELEEGDSFCSGHLKQGRFVKAPDEIDFVSLMSDIAGPKEIKGEWWWVQRWAT